jgi:hypothetical protein
MKIDSLDPNAARYRKSRRDRRKFKDPTYKGPERRLEEGREQAIRKTLSKLESELRTH